MHCLPIEKGGAWGPFTYSLGKKSSMQSEVIGKDLELQVKAE